MFKEGFFILANRGLSASSFLLFFKSYSGSVSFLRSLTRSGIFKKNKRKAFRCNPCRICVKNNLYSSEEASLSSGAS